MGRMESSKTKTTRSKSQGPIQSLTVDQLTRTAGERGDQAKNVVVRVVLNNCHVQAVEALAQNTHDAGGDFSKIGILYRQKPVRQAKS